MFQLNSRFSATFKASAYHLLGSLLVAACAAVLVFRVWYPYPYGQLAGGRELFLLVVAVDVVSGPLLTMVLYNPAKPRAELCRDLGLVVLIQLAALGYGLHVVWQARPLYLVQEVDRFKVLSMPDLDMAEQRKLPIPMQVNWVKGPITVHIQALDVAEGQEKGLLETVLGRRDSAERPDVYRPSEGAAALQSHQRA